MDKKNSSADEISYYKRLFKLESVSFSLINHDDAIVAVVYQITTSKEQFILKVCEREKDYLREIYFLKYFQHKLPVAKIIKLVEPTGSIPGAILMEYLPGALLTQSELSEKLAYELGSSFAKIHNERVSGYGDPILQTLNKEPSTFFMFKFEEGIGECKNHLSERMLKNCKDFFLSHLSLLKDVDGPCIVHRDFRPGNIIINNGNLQGIIDWAGARFGFAEEDFCSIEHGEWLSAEMKKHFFLGYSSIRLLPKYDHLIPLLRLSKAIATIGYLIKTKSWENTNQKLYHYNYQFLETLIG